jgi:hypothetical protein
MENVTVNMTVWEGIIQGGSNMTRTNCDLFTHKSVPVIFEPPCIRKEPLWVNFNFLAYYAFVKRMDNVHKD